MENTAATGAETPQNQPASMESAPPASLYLTHPSYVYSDPQYALYYQQAQIANPNLQQQYDANGSLVHPPGVDPNPAVAYANAATYLDAQQLAYYYAAYPQAVASGPAATAAYYQDPNAVHLAYSQYSNGAVMQPSVTHRSANPNSALRGRRNVGVRKTNTPMKKRPKIAKVVQSAWCEVCKVDCNSKDVLDKHKEGKKHKKNIEKLIAASKPAPPPPPPPPPVQVLAPVSTSDASATCNNTIIGPQENPSKGKSSGSKKGKRRAADMEDLETKKKKMLEGGADAGAVRWCDVCSVVCNSETVFTYHLAGQKHAFMEKRHAIKMRRLAAAPKAKTAPAPAPAPAPAATIITTATNAEPGTTTTNAEPSTATNAEPSAMTIAEAGATTNPETNATTTNAETDATTSAATA